VLALGFGPEKEAAATLAISALLQPFEIAWRRHVEAWEEWHARSVNSSRCPAAEEIHVSAMVLAWRARNETPVKGRWGWVDGDDHHGVRVDHLGTS
jgi:hypothetical protein